MSHDTMGGAVGLAGRVVAVTAGGAGAMFGFADVAATGFSASNASAALASLAVAILGLIAREASSGYPILKMLMEDREKSRAAATARHDLRDKVHGYAMRIEVQERLIADLQALAGRNAHFIDLLVNRNADPTAAHPDSLREYRDASAALARPTTPPPTPTTTPTEGDFDGEV